MTLSADLAAETAVAMAIAQAPTVLEDLRKAGLCRQWFSDQVIGVLVEGAMRLHLQGKEVSLLALVSHCSDELGKAGWERATSLWLKANGSEPIQWEQYVSSLKAHSLLREVDGILLDLNEQKKQAPKTVKDWLAHFIQRFRAALEAGQDYDPTPSVIWEKGEPTKVVASTGIETLDEVYRGGLRNGILVVWAAPTGTGKSRMTYTMAAHGVGQKCRVVVISTEAQPFDVVGGVLQAYCGFEDHEIADKRGSDEIRDKWLAEALADLDKYLFVWGREAGNKRAINEILYWVKPTHLILDHLLPMAQQGRSARKSREETIYDFADFLEAASVKHRCTITAFAQMSAVNSSKFIRNHDLPELAVFGSSGPSHAASIGIISMRHWEEYNTMYGRVKKDRLTGQVDTEFTLSHDPATHTFGDIVPPGKGKEDWWNG